MLAAAQAKRDAGALDAALGLLVVAGAGPPDALSAAQAEHLRGQIALDQQRGTAPRLLLGAARLLDPLNPSLAREAHLEALSAASRTPPGRPRWCAGGGRGRARRAA